VIFCLLLSALRFALGTFLGILHNTAVKSLAWFPALVLSAILHSALILPNIPRWAQAYAGVKHQVLDSQQMQMFSAVAIGWCVIMAVWCAMVTNVLAHPENRYGGLSGFRLAVIVAGLALAVDLIDSPCLWTFPPVALVVPILSYVAISNTSQPFPEGEQSKTDPPAHG
jgi:hypothetical protein